jgi:GxxExxY protein
MENVIYKDESYTIIGICMEVHRELGNGFDEIVYKDALEIEFKERKIPYKREKKFEVFYKNIPLNRFYYVDFYMYDKINLEIKAKSVLVDDHMIQTKNYCACSKTKLGLLVNFGRPSLEHKRILI